MLIPLRHLLAILLLPFVAVVVVPGWLLLHAGMIDTRWEAWLPRSVGAILFASGLALFAWCLGLFVRVGHGTLARGTQRAILSPSGRTDMSATQ